MNAHKPLNVAVPASHRPNSPSATQSPAVSGATPQANLRLFPVYRFVGGIGTTLAYFFDDGAQNDFLLGRLSGFDEPIKLYGAPSTNVGRVVEVDRRNRFWNAQHPWLAPLDMRTGLPIISNLGRKGVGL